MESWLDLRFRRKSKASRYAPRPLLSLIFAYRPNPSSILPVVDRHRAARKGEASRVSIWHHPSNP